MSNDKTYAVITFDNGDPFKLAYGTIAVLDAMLEDLARQHLCGTRARFITKSRHLELATWQSAKGSPLYNE